ncbi:MAG: hypothetical protein LBR86_06780 [Tannerella sp.]|jgi:uncharacterized membrane protein YbhN (UPF0104 family)|nr:hypothetical protein [Tannerella sp.]
MKEIVITVKRQKREIGWLCGAVIAALLMNVYAIRVYHTSWNELWTQLPWVICIGAGLYALSVVLRGMVWGVWRLFRKK